MKKSTASLQMAGLVIIMGLFSIFPLTGKAQIKVFPEKDAIWCIYDESGYTRDMYLYGLTGDTVIQEKQYSKLYLLNDTTLNIDEGDEYVGAIRTEERKVWMYPQNSNIDREFLLYDFSRNKGEEIMNLNFVVEYSPIPGFKLPDEDFNEDDEHFKTVVLDIIEDDLGRKHYKIEGGQIGYDEWIEGIGSLKGLFFYSLVIYTGGYPIYPKLVSLKQGDSIVYHNKDICDQPFCWFGVGVEDTQQKQTVTLYPNPVKETLHIDLGDTPLPIRFDLFDTQGHIIHTKNLTNPHTTVTPPPHSKGLHHYRLTGSDGKALQSGQLLIE